jgi:arsenical pump membrane protein
MSPTTRVVLTLAIVLPTLLATALKPRRISEAWVTSIGAVLLLVLGLVTPKQAFEAAWVGKEALLFLVALVLLSRLVDRSGAFAWAALHAARSARGNGMTLYRNVFLLGSIVTALLSLDTTAVILTPILLALVDKLRLPAKPYLITCAFVANTGSLALPISNLTNLLMVRELGVPMGSFIVRMIAPQAVALLATYFLLRRLFRQDLSVAFDHRTIEDPGAVIPHRGYFHAACVVLALTLVGFFVVHFFGVDPYVIGFGGVVVLGIFGLTVKQVRPTEFLHAPWALVIFVLGLFVLVQSVENLGLSAMLITVLNNGVVHGSMGVAASAGAGALMSNGCNNLPATLLAIPVLQQSPSPTLIYGTLLGVNIGPNLLPTASLATMLVLSVAREKGVVVTGGDVIRAGIRTTPVVLAAAVAALVLTFLVRP